MNCIHAIFLNDTAIYSVLLVDSTRYEQKALDGTEEKQIQDFFLFDLIYWFLHLFFFFSSYIFMNIIWFDTIF